MIHGANFAEVYDKLLRTTLENGEEVSPRGMLTKELEGETFCIEDPTSSLVYIPERNFSLCHAVLESMLLFVNNNSVNVAGYFNKNLKQFSDDGKTLYGSYGTRIADSIPGLIQKLKEDKDTRQATLVIRKCEDVCAETKDQPCTIALHFIIRNGKLNLHVYMRSNDLVWGTPYDVFNFTNAQQVIANELGILVGKYFHTSTSFHVYERDFELVKRSIGNCKPVRYVNSAGIEWKKQSERFAKYLENDAFPYLLKLNKEQALLYLERIHRKDCSLFEKKLIFEHIYNKYDLSFAKDFTNRWVKAGYISKEVHDK